MWLAFKSVLVFFENLYNRKLVSKYVHDVHVVYNFVLITGTSIVNNNKRSINATFEEH